MFTLKNAKYRGVTFDFEGERKSDLVECLAGIDYYLAREAAPHTPPEGDATAEADKKEEAKTTRRRPAASKKTAATKTEDIGEDDGDSTLDEKAAADTKAAEEKAAKEKAEAEAKAKAKAEAKAKDEEKPEFTADDVKGRLQQYIEAFGAVQAKEMLGRYGVAKRSELDDKQTVEIMAEMEDRLEAGE